MWESVQERNRRVLSVVLLLVLLSCLLCYSWISRARECVHSMPDTDWEDISCLTKKVRWSEADFRLLSEQTGLGRSALEKMKLQNREKELLDIQKIYFAPVQTEAVNTTPLTVSEWIVNEDGCPIKGMPIIDVRNGDILVTSNSRFLGWRNGHAGLVVDAEAGLVLEALMLGTDSQLCNLDKWESYPSFAVLRLKSDGEENAEIANALAKKASEYAGEELVGIPYRLLAGVFELYEPAHKPDPYLNEEKSGQGLKGTQCAHLVWYAYYLTGIDLDSDGGIFVTPGDIRNSPYLEVVQSYGF